MGRLRASILFFASLPGTAAAQAIAEGNGGGASLRLFRPAIDSKGLFSVNGSAVLGHLDPSFGLVADGGFGLVAIGGREVVPSAWTGTLHASLGLANFAVAGVQMPVGILELDGAPAGAGLASADASVQGLAEPVLHGKLRFLRAERNPVGLALVLQAGLPGGDARGLLADPGGSVWPSIVVDADIGRRARLAANAGYRVVLGDGSTIGAQADAGRFEYGDQITAGAGGSYQVVLGTLDVVGEAYASRLATGGGAALAAEALGGLRVFLERRSCLTLAAGAGVVDGWAAADRRLVLGFVFEPSIGDADGDGLRDDVDRCPSDPEDHDGFEDEDGCPEPDDDRDGLLDVDDACPRIPEDRDAVEDGDGCPEGNEGDRDGDGIADASDECPDEPEDLDDFEDAEGCPEPDNDRDRIADVEDLCPDDPEDVDRFEDLEGCPDPDNDQDRIADVEDTCPDDPERYNGTDDEDGCPDTGVVSLEEGALVPLEPIHFETDSAVIQTRSSGILDAIAATLRGNPQIRFVEIQGHADERAPDDYNLDLTRERAASVLGALLQRGVAPDRLRSAGYGERCPRDPRHVAGAWERNRRVEFKILRTDAGPTNVEIACPAGRDLVPR